MNTVQQIELVRKVLAKQAPSLSSRISKTPIFFSDERIRQQILDAVVAELFVSGLLPNDEPNAYGLLLEELVDMLNSHNSH